ncbi:MAG: hypothetical protein ABJZ55_10925 [Fuerstiella sp.]
MAAKLSPEIDQAIKAHGSPLQVVSADEQTQYVIISNEQFNLYRSLFDQDGLSVQEQKAILARNGRKAGWDDPEMDAYDNSCPTQ